MVKLSKRVEVAEMSDLPDWISAIGGLSGFVALGVTGVAELRRRRELSLAPLYVETSRLDEGHLEIRVQYRCKDLSEGLTLVVEPRDPGARAWVAPEHRYFVNLYGRPDARTVSGPGDARLSLDMAVTHQSEPAFEAEFVVNAQAAARIKLTIKSSASGIKRAVATIHASAPA